MTRKDFSTFFSDLLLECMAKPAPMLHLLEWLCARLMETEANGKLSACKSERTEERSGCRSGCRVRKWDTRMGTIYLLIPRLRGRAASRSSWQPVNAAKALLCRSSKRHIYRASLPARWKNPSRALVSTLCREAM